MKDKSKPQMMLQTATASAKCYGCDGEMPINPGDMVLADDGVTGGEVFCMRCAVAIAAKMTYCKTAAFRIKKGDLRSEQLSNAFRKRWNKLIKDIHGAGEDRERQRQLAKEIMDEYGMRAPEAEELPQAEPKKERKKRSPKTPEQKNAEAVQKAGSIGRKMRQKLAELTSAQFAVKVALQETGAATTCCDVATAKKTALDALCDDLEQIIKWAKGKEGRKNAKK